MAHRSNPTALERFWFILGIGAILVLVTSLRVIAFGGSGNWFTPVGMLFTGGAAFGGYAIERRRRRSDEAQTSGASEVD